MQDQVHGATTTTDPSFWPLELPAVSISAFSARVHRICSGNRFRESTRLGRVSTFPKGRAT
jgi:hypothetical protein